HRCDASKLLVRVGGVVTFACNALATVENPNKSGFRRWLFGVQVFGTITTVMCLLTVALAWSPETCAYVPSAFAWTFVVMKQFESCFVCQGVVVVHRWLRLSNGWMVWFRWFLWFAVVFGYQIVFGWMVWVFFHGHVSVPEQVCIMTVDSPAVIETLVLGDV